MFVAHGLYKLSFDFGAADDYRARLEQVREQQKLMLKNGQASICATTWTIDGNAAKGRKMIKDQLKLLLRAFNGECDAAISKVRYDNIESMINRMQRSFEAINKTGSVNQCQITHTYLRAKLDELELVHGYQERLQAEREEQRQIREQMREEEKAARELEKAEREAAKQEGRLAEQLARAEADAAKAREVGAQNEQLMQRVEDLKRQLEVAKELHQRAISRAQLTRPATST
ncbi:MAG: DUF4041 domain-containing protein [Deltaproteobacteria bacterium]|nr:DUF4041 domain-containing protein [Deltaproteobacteria bacterium]